MNYSRDERTYGRKIVRGQRKKINYARRLFLLMATCFLIGGMIGALVSGLIVHNNSKQSEPIISSEPTEPIVNKTTALLVGSPKEDDFIALDVPMNEELQRYVFDKCKEINMDFCLVMALIETESSFQADAMSNTDDYGLMQINSFNHEWLSAELGITDFFDPKQNIDAGMYILGILAKKYEDPHMILMCYNMGESRAKTLWKQNIYSSKYSRKITDRQADFQQEIEERINHDKYNIA